jgi:hypothetical protein
MGEAVIVDDGGSTRIKQLKDNVDMDDLMVAPNTAQADGKFGNPGTPSCNLIISHIESGPNTGANSPAVTKDPPIPMAAGDVVTITSGNGQTLTITLHNSRALTLQLSAAGGATPIVEARQQDLRRRYIVSNAGPISTITHSGVGANPVYSAVAETVYTCVQFKD